MSSTASADLADPALRRAGWCGPVVARERGPGYAAGDGAGGDAGERPDGGRGGLGAVLGAADCEAVGAALAGLPARRLAGVLASAVGRLGGEDAAAVATSAARALPADAAVGLCRSLLAGWDSADLLTVAEEAVSGLGRRTLGPGAVPDAVLHESWERVLRLERRVVGEKLRRLREIDERGSYRTEGARTAIDLLVRHGLTYGEAREQVETAVALGELAKTDRALAEGTIGLGQAAEAARALSEANKARADAARKEAEARAEAARRDAEGRAEAARREDEARAQGGGEVAEGGGGDAQARAADERAAEEARAEARAAGERAAAARAADRDEIDEAVAGAAPDVNRRALRERLAREAARRSSDGAADKARRVYRNRHVRKFSDGDGETLQVHGPADALAPVWRMLQALANAPGGAADDRTPEQRRFDGLRHAADRYLREGALPDVAGHPAQVLLIASPAALHDVEGADPCTLDGCGPVSSQTARMICCDAEITVLITDEDGQPLRLGRTRYAPTRAQRRAVTARDRVCVGCGADTTYCEVHHIRWWRNNGPTDIDNLVLTCWNCHTHIHHHGWWVWRDPHGRYRAGPHPPPDARHVDGGAPGGGGPAPGPRPPGRPPAQDHTPGPRPSAARATTPAAEHAEPSLWETDPSLDESPPHRRTP